MAIISLLRTLAGLFRAVRPAPASGQAGGAGGLFDGLKDDLRPSPPDEGRAAIGASGRGAPNPAQARRRVADRAGPAQPTGRVAPAWGIDVLRKADRASAMVVRVRLRHPRPAFGDKSEGALGGRPGPRRLP